MGIKKPALKNQSLKQALKGTPWISEKIKRSEIYAQNMYAALCSNVFMSPSAQEGAVDEESEEVLSRLSWREAGALVAEIRDGETFLDWYCSGIFIDDRQGNAGNDSGFSEVKCNTGNVDMASNTNETASRTIESFVPEQTITPEVRLDLETLGWVEKIN